MERHAFAFLLLTLPLLNVAVTSENRKRMEKIRRLYEHDGIDTGTVHISYPHSPSKLRRLTKREALTNLVGQPRRHANVTVRVTMSASGHALDLHLAPSQLQMHGALVTVMNGDNVEEQFHLRDEGCHFYGSLEGAGGDGMVSVHFCDGELVGGANDGHTEYCFHSYSLHSHWRRRSRSRETSRDDSGKNVHSGESKAKKDFGKNKLKNPNGENKIKNVSGETNVKIVDDAKDPEKENNDLVGSTTGNEELYHTIVSWKKMNVGRDNRTPLTNDYIVVKKNKKKKNKKNVRTKRKIAAIKELKNTLKKGKKQAKDRQRRQAENETNKLPVVELGIVVDEEYLQATKHMYPTRDNVVRMLMIKYTGVQSLYLSPEVTNFKLKIQVKLVYLWKKNPSFYKGSNGTLGDRLSTFGRIFSEKNVDFGSTDVGSLFAAHNTPYTGLAYVAGACFNNQKYFTTLTMYFNYIAEAHELGHVLGLKHVPHTCVNTTPPSVGGFMNGGHRFLPCYGVLLNSQVKNNKLKCLFSQDVYTTNIPAIELQPLHPVLALGLNYHCRASFRNDSVFLLREKGGKKGVMCAVTGETERAFSMAQFNTNYGNPSFTPQGTWGEWSSFAKNCSSNCGVGIRISFRECSVPDRPEECVGYRYRALLCNTQPCHGDDLMTEEELRVDRGNYMCSLLKARKAPQSTYLKPQTRPLTSEQWSNPSFMCLVTCEVSPRPEGSPSFQRGFGSALQVDGTLCGKVNFFKRHVRGVTARCLRGQCREFGCNGRLIGEGGKAMDNCGVCGGDGSSCQSQTKKFSVGKEEQLVKLLPAGTDDVLVALQPDNPEGEVAGHMMLALVNKDDEWIIHPSDHDCSRIVTNEKNPLKFAGTHWTVFGHVVLRAPGPLDQPMKVKVRNYRGNPAQDVTVLLRFTPPASFIVTPMPCENGGRANATTRGCDCAKDFYGRHCETRCRSPCYNGGIVMGKHCDCQCVCKVNPGIDPTRRCRCLEGFTGPDCTECILKCFNGGTLNKQTCECVCPPGCSKVDCSGCKYNKKIPLYKGQYGRGSLEVSADLKVNQASPLLHRPVESLRHHQLLVAVGVVLWWGNVASFTV